MKKQLHSHRSDSHKGGRIRAWVIEEKVAGVWVKMRIHHGKDGPKAGRGQRVRPVKGKELRGLSMERRIPMSEEEIDHTLGW